MDSSQDNTTSVSSPLVPSVTLDVGGKLSQNTTLWFPVTCVTTKNFLVTTNCSKGTVYVFQHSNNTATSPIGEYRTMFTRHEARVHDMAHLLSDIVVSVDKLGKAVIWDVKTFEIMDSFEAPDYRRLLYVHKLDETAFVIAATSIRTGNVAHMLYVCEHTGGRNIKIVQENKLSPGGVIFGTHERNLYVKTTVKAFRYNIDTMKKLSFSNPPIPSSYNFEFFAAVSPDYIILSYWNQSMLIYSNYKDCAHIRTIEVSSFAPFPPSPGVPANHVGNENDSDSPDGANESLRAITVISADILMVTTQNFGVYFITPTGEVVAKIDVTKSFDLRNACVLADGRICVVGADAYCGIWPCPPEVRQPVLKYALNNVGIGIRKPENGRPVQANGIQSEPRNSIVKDDSPQPVERNQQLLYPVPVSVSVSSEKPKLLQLKARHTAAMERLEKKLADQSIKYEAVCSERRAEKAKLLMEASELRKEMMETERVNGALRKKLAVCEVKLSVVDSEKEKLAKELQERNDGGNPNINSNGVTVRNGLREHELQAELDAEREKGRKYQTEKDIEAVQIRAQMDVQKIQLKSYKEELEWQQKKTEKAEAELKRIRAMENNNNANNSNNNNNINSNSNPPPKKRRMLNAEQNHINNVNHH